MLTTTTNVKEEYQIQDEVMHTTYEKHMQPNKT